jgi:uncharacterized HAD superfamily protein
VNYKQLYKLRKPYDPLRIGIDVDGLLADFNYSYLQELFGKVPEGWNWAKDPNRWNYEREWGATDAVVQKTWDRIGGSWEKAADFWGNLKVLATDDEVKAIKYVNWESDLYFVTNRPLVAKATTDTWINENIVKYPTVLLTDKKGHISHGLSLHCLIDDKPQNLQQVLNWCGNECVPFLLDRPWNQNYTDRYIIRVKTINEALDILNEIVG